MGDANQSKDLPEDGGPLLDGISVVVPCYNSRSTLEELTVQLRETLARCCDDFEIILVNDASEDDTWTVIGSLAARHREVRGLHLMRNYGQHNATLCGVRAARHAITVTLDDDLQQPPAEIPRLVEALEGGYDLVYGTPERRSHSPFRNLMSWITRWAIAAATGHRGVRHLSSFRAFRTGLRRAFADHASPDVILDVLLGWGTTRITSLRVSHHPRRAGRSNYRLLRLVNTVYLLWMGYTTAPLRFASWLGFAFVLFGVAVLAHVLRVYFFEGSLPGFPFLASTIAIFGGVQLFALGVFGEYLAGLFGRSLGRPAYVIKERTPDDDR